jgi:hypothetical protein
MADVVGLAELALDVLDTFRQLVGNVPESAALEAIRRILACLDEVRENDLPILAARREIARIVADAHVANAT